jgi:hypothetical protein
LGVLTALLDRKSPARITLFDIARPLRRPEFSGPPESGLIEAYYDEVYQTIWRQQSRKFPPPKTHFAETLPKFEIGGRAKIFRSDPSVG